MRLTLPTELQDPELDQRGYPGELACYRAGLKQVNPDQQPNGWGRLHHAMGRAHYFHHRFEQNAVAYCRQAVAECTLALTTLTAAAFPKAHLAVLQDAMRAYLGLGDTAQAQALREQGLAVFRELLKAQPSSRQRERLELEFSGFSQLAVDLLVQEGATVAALEAAERYKNRTLTWMLDAWQETVVSPSLAEMATLVDDATALVMWHLSPDALTRFVVLPGATAPLVTASTQPSQRLDTWLKTWDQDYQDYRSKGKTAEEPSLQAHPWRQNLAARLATLADILDISSLEATLADAGITQVRLVPHRDLHRLPLQALFSTPLTVTYLPSVQVGLTLQRREPGWVVTAQTSILSVEEPASAELPRLVFAEIESALICQSFSQPIRLDADAATEARVTAALAAGPSLVHFTGHGFFNDRQPRQSALAGADQLTVEAIRALSLSGCGLVSLAACETAVTGSTTIQADYVGLASAFLKAGAGAVLSTLWTVESVSNAWLMVYFYDQLLMGRSPAVALRAAQQWLRTVTQGELANWLQAWLTPELEASDPHAYDALVTEIRAIQPDGDKMEVTQLPYADPYYWAAFVIAGISIKNT